MTRARTLCLAGPTASGKTDAALAMARHLNGSVEIISVDSALVYRGMDIGTAKPGTAERAAVVHHLIDIRDPLQAYNAADFLHNAKALIGDIHSRGHVALLVGGTMLYFKALFEGLASMPPADAAVRAEIDAMGHQLGWPAVHADLARVDPTTAARLSPNDSQRIQRALEVFRVTGLALSSFHTSASIAPDSQGLGQLPLLSLEPQDRAWLQVRIATRFEHMLQSGLIDEVQRLRSRGDLRLDLPSMRCVGYRQTWQALDEAGGAALNAAQMSALCEQGIFATRQLAKRQITWLRAMPWRQVVPCDGPGVWDQVAAWVDAQV